MASAGKLCPEKTLCAVDLFSGCGGMTQGLKKAGFRVRLAVEVDPLAAETYRSNHSEVVLIERSIRDVPAAEVLRALGIQAGALDLLAGCPPCQGFSSLRTLNGGRRVRDDRNALIDDYLRFVRVLRPKAVMLENVPGLAAKQRFRRMVAELRRIGYKVNSAVLDASRYGVPQRRRRLILLAGRSRRLNFADTIRSRPTVRTTIASLPLPAESKDPLHGWCRRPSNAVERLIRAVPKDGGSRTDLPRHLWLDCHKKADGFFDVYGRMKWDDVAPTITGGCLNPSKGRFLHPEQDRAITPREAALLQGFPRTYRFSTRRGMYAIAQMIGNALPPEFVRCHAAKVVEVLTLAESQLAARTRRRG